MTWVKRNLPFVIGAAVAVVLLGLAGFFLFTKYSEESQVAEELGGRTSRLQELVTQPVHPGTDKVNNIQATKDEQLRWQNEFLKPARQLFPVLSTNAGADVSQLQLRIVSTVAELQRAATNSSVEIPPQFGFSFSAQQRTLRLDGSVADYLAIQLSDVRELAMMLFRSKIHKLISFQRVSVSTNETMDSGDFLPKSLAQITTNDTLGAVLFPYRMTFVSHSAEIARMMSEIARSEGGYTVKYVSVQPYSPETEGEEGSGESPAGAGGEMARRYGGGMSPDLARRYGLGGGMAPDLARRYGMGGGGGRYGGSRYGGGRYGGRGGMAPMPMPMSPLVTTNQPATGVFLKENQLQVSIMVEAVKLFPEGFKPAPKARKAAAPADAEGQPEAPAEPAAPAPADG